MVKSEYAARLREKAASLPLTPGVYIMRDITKKVIYVGKSRAIKNRVSQYFHESGTGSIKTEAMTAHIYDFDYILCDTEIEALSLENNLIKLYTPRYNIRLKDDKSYPYLKATVEEDYPRFLVTRKREKGKSKYFGPYTSIATVYGIISALQKTFGLPSCKRVFPKDKGKVKHCIYKQLGCIAPCDPEVTAEQYKESFMEAVSFLDGNYQAIVDALEEKMNYASENLAFEAAAAYRDRIRSVKKLQEKQKVVAGPNVERDIIAWQVGDPISSICIFYIRFGKLIDSELFYFSGGEILDSAAVVSFMLDLYAKREYIPKEITPADELNEEDAEALSDLLTEKAGYTVHIHTPFRGDSRKLCDMAKENAVMRAKEYAKSTEKTEKSLVRLATLCGLETVPERIEAFDISNFGDEAITAGMVVYVDGKPKKSDYRLFSIRGTETRDDFLSMREAVSRHLAHLSDENAKIPDLLLIDGGEVHRNIAAEEVKKAGYAIPVFGMVKDDFHKTRALVGEGGEISIATEQAVYTLIYKIQEEVHRFTISKMKQKKGKTEVTSVLQDVKGIGIARAKAILTHFGGLEGVKNATLEELTELRGITPEMANDIIKQFHNP